MSAQAFEEVTATASSYEEITKREDLSSVAHHVHSCLLDFQEVYSKLSKARPSIKTKLAPAIIKDVLGGFRLWSANVGAHRIGRGSLDYKLREASHIRDQVIKLVQSTKAVLHEVFDIVTGQRPSWEDMSDSESDAEEDSANDHQKPDTPELVQLAAELKETNACLMRLSVAIRNPAPHDQFKESAHIDTAYYEPFDIAHVHGKFPKAPEYLSVRLGKAISRRRQYLRYRDDHRKKYEQGLPIKGTLPRVGAHREVESTVASSLPPAVKDSVDLADLEEEDEYDEAQSVTSYASSGHDPEKLRPPPLPMAGRDGEPFVCKLCFRFTAVRHAKAWQKHVYRDLQPYVSSLQLSHCESINNQQVCTMEDCEMPDRTYESRHEWFRHETQIHRKWWQCVNSCDKPFQSSSSLQAHIAREHPSLATGDRIGQLVRSCERHRSMTAKATCPLCLDEVSSLTILRRHVGKHLEELSLFAVPAHVSEEQEDKEDPDSSDEEGEKAAGSRGSLTDSSNSSTALSVIECGVDGCEVKYKGLGKELFLGVHRGQEHNGPLPFCCEDHLRQYIRSSL
jgi:hypothetical protein